MAASATSFDSLVGIRASDAVVPGGPVSGTIGGVAAALLGLSSGKRRDDLASRTISVASEEELEAIRGEGSFVGLNFVPAIVKDPEHSDGKRARGNRRPAKAVGQF
jgi:hypothetical protein